MASGLGIGCRRNFQQLLCSLLNFRVKVLTEGDKEWIRGILTDVNCDFITISGCDICYVPICEIVAICRDFSCAD
ncbi:MAG: DUF2642 domain-containing protein [Syntrophomonadaceae bacterium]|nr:DUF2642 domain-containing protein [Syntrophomonadaceae bacterium]